MTTPSIRPARSNLRDFPPFDLATLLRTVFAPRPGERICILIDLEEPREIEGFRFLQDRTVQIQRHAHDLFYQGLRSGVLFELELQGGEMFAYRMTGGSNLDLPDKVYGVDRQEFEMRELLASYDIVLCVSTFSATAPLTALAKEIGFRGATLHGINDVIIASGLAVDYEEVSRQAEKLRKGLTRADSVDIVFQVDGRESQLHLDLGAQEAQKSHGLCRIPPDVVNLPAGEVYFVPRNAAGEFPMKYADGTLGLMRVTGGRVVAATLLHGKQDTVDEHNAKLKADPLIGELGELGFGTQELPVSGADIQDEKIFGTFHVATGRSDHLGGGLTPDKFVDRGNATHEDILFSPTKTPEITVSEVRMNRGSETVVLIENYIPADYLTDLLQ